MKQKTLGQIEQSMELGIHSVVAGLLEIYERKLFKQDCKTIEQYGSDRWGFAKSRTYQLIQMGETQRRISTIVEKLPSNESHYREIQKAPAENQAKIVASVMEKCEETKRAPTAKDYRAAVKPFIEVTKVEPEVVETPPPKPPPAATIDDWKKDRQCIVKTCQHMMRAVEDLCDAHPYSQKAKNTAVACCQQIEKLMKEIV